MKTLLATLRMDGMCLSLSDVASRTGLSLGKKTILTLPRPLAAIPGQCASDSSDTQQCMGYSYTLTPCFYIFWFHKGPLGARDSRAFSSFSADGETYSANRDSPFEVVSSIRSVLYKSWESRGGEDHFNTVLGGHLSRATECANP